MWLLYFFDDFLPHPKWFSQQHSSLPTYFCAKNVKCVRHTIWLIFIKFFTTLTTHNTCHGITVLTWNLCPNKTNPLCTTKKRCLWYVAAILPSPQRKDRQSQEDSSGNKLLHLVYS